MSVGMGSKEEIKCVTTVIQIMMTVAAIHALLSVDFTRTPTQDILQPNITIYVATVSALFLKNATTVIYQMGMAVTLGVNLNVATEFAVRMV